MVLKKTNKHIAFLVQLPKKVSPSQRFRIEQFEPFLSSKGIIFDTYPFIGKQTYKIFYKRGFFFQKAFGVLVGFLRRFGFLFKAYQYDYIFIQRMATPIGPPIYEWILAKLLRKKLIFDFDDAIWIPDSSGASWLMQIAKCYWKIKDICRWSYKISAGNEYLERWARRYNKNTVIIPTCVDTQQRYRFLHQHQDKKVTIGWTGSHSTLRFLNIIYPVLQKLEQTHDFTFLVICDRPPDFSLQSMQFLPWNEVSEIEDLMKIDIGIMPLEVDAWSEGKCGFKLIQYLALGIPAVASPVGVNKKIVTMDNGFLCGTEEDWYNALATLIHDAQLREKMGCSGRKKILDEYSIQEKATDFLSLFD